MNQSELLNLDQINCIANDYNDLWKAGAITDKDHAQVEDLIVSHLATIQQMDLMKKYIGFLKSCNRSGEQMGKYEDIEEFAKSIQGADTR